MTECETSVTGKYLILYKPVGGIKKSEKTAKISLTPWHGLEGHASYS